MNRPHIIATEDFHLEVYDLTSQTKKLLKQAAKQVEETIDEEPKTTRQETVVKKKPVQKKQTKKSKKKVKDTRLFNESELLARYHKVPVYRPIVRYITEHIGDTITTKEIKKHIDTYYTKFLKRTLSKKSLRSYASAYIRYFKEHKQYVEQPDKQSWKKTKPVTIDDLSKKKEKKEKAPPIDYSEKYSYAQTIYEKMGKNNGQGQILTVKQIMNVTNLDKDQVELGISALIQKNLATQQPRGIQLREM